MKRKIITITCALLLVAAKGYVLASNKAKIDKAAAPVSTGITKVFPQFARLSAVIC